MRTKEREKRLAALELATMDGICLAWPDDDPPRYLVNGAPVSFDAFQAARARAAHVITVQYTEEWKQPDATA